MLPYQLDITTNISQPSGKYSIREWYPRDQSLFDQESVIDLTKRMLLQDLLVPDSLLAFEHMQVGYFLPEVNKLGEVQYDSPSSSFRVASGKRCECDLATVVETGAISLLKEDCM